MAGKSNEAALSFHDAGYGLEILISRNSFSKFKTDCDFQRHQD
jgi:hypothetical protein